jgi:hypothetical protein
LQSSKVPIAIAVIEAPFGTLLVSAPRGLLLGGTHELRARMRAVPPTTAAPSAKHQKNTAMRAASLNSGPEHQKPTPKSWLPRGHRRSCAHLAAHLSKGCSLSNLKARSG